MRGDGNGGVNLWSSHQGGADHPSATQSRKYGGCACGGRTRKHRVECVDGDVDLGFIVFVVYRTETGKDNMKVLMVKIRSS